MVGSPQYRLYIDEVGNSDLGSSDDPNHRYLSLTGVIIELDYVYRVVAPQLEALKKCYFDYDVDDPLIFHRKELVNKQPPFIALRDPGIETRFNADLLKLIGDLDYAVVTVVIDKLEHKTRYRVWRYDPYHYCQQVLLERYVLWLDQRGCTGDVLAESRGKKENRRLADAFARVYDTGTKYVAETLFRKCLTSKQLKIKPKESNIAGLQLADLLAYPSYKSLLARHEGTQLPNNFGRQIVEILEKTKYVRSPKGQIDGWGLKWLP